MTVLAWIVSALLCVFAARRYLYWAGSWLPRRPHAPSRSPSIVVLVAAQNEAVGLPSLLTALAASDYPAERLHVVIISDASTDGTAEIARLWAARHPGAQALVRTESQGKGAALQAGLALAPSADLIAVIDADTTPRPDALAQLAGAFEDPRVGAVGGYPDPGRSHGSMVARYAALERWSLHLVTLAGKDRLGAQPGVMGAISCFRAEALAAIGGFAAGTLVEDIEASVAIVNAGWKTRWIGEAVSLAPVATSLDGFRRQRLRWSRGLMSTAGRSGRVEDLLVAAGYLDRLVFAAGVGLALAGRGPVWAPVAYAAAPIVIVLTALIRSGTPNKVAYLASIIPMTSVDLAVTLESSIPRWVRPPLAWRIDAKPRTGPNDVG